MEAEGRVSEKGSQRSSKQRWKSKVEQVKKEAKGPVKKKEAEGQTFCWLGYLLKSSDLCLIVIQITIQKDALRI